MVSQVYIEKKLQRIKTFGHSMYPLLHNGDIVYLKKTAFGRLKVNDIICFKKYGILQTHRIIYRADKYLITKGDNNFKADGRVYERQVIGRVYQVKRGDEIFDPEDIYLVQSTLYFQEIVKIKKAFEKAGIDFVFLKGLPLHLYYEKAHPRRLYADCDILIDRDDLVKIDKIFNNFLYKRERRHENSSLKKIRSTYVELSYFSTIQRLPLTFDIHLEPAFLTYHRGKFNKIYPQKTVDAFTQRLLAKKQSLQILGETFPVLSDADFVIYLALHIFHHQFKGLYRLMFLDIVLRSYSQDKNSTLHELLMTIQETSTAYHLQPFIYPCFLLLDNYFQNPIAKQILKRIHPTQKKMKTINTIVSNYNFDLDNVNSNSISRFSYLFSLSLTPFYKKMLVFFEPSVFLSLLRITYRALLLSRLPVNSIDTVK